MDIDKITVAIATFRRPEGLAQAMSGLVDQKFPRLKILIGDDDPRPEVAEIINNTSGVEILYIPNVVRQGVLRNHLGLLVHNESDMFMFHGDDDCLLPNALRSLSEILKTSQYYGQVFSNYLSGPEKQVCVEANLANVFFVRFWRSKYRLIRMVSFYLCPAFSGKQNLFYGLYRTTAINEIDFGKALPRRKLLLNMDEMIAYQATCNKPTLILNQICYYFAAGNVKLYDERGPDKQGTISAFFALVWYEFATLSDYVRNTESLAEKLILLGLFPVKFLLALLMRYATWRK